MRNIKLVVYTKATNMILIMQYIIRGFFSNLSMKHLIMLRAKLYELNRPEYIDYDRIVFKLILIQIWNKFDTNQ